jgi:CRISPR-associated protein Cas1
MLSLNNDVDGRLSNSSWAYRVGRGVQGALAELRRSRAEGYVWTLDADIAHYFDRVPHYRLIDELTIWIDDVRIVDLIRLWLRSFSFWGRGIAQGAPISPLLANLFLHPMDRLIEAEGLRFIRYADNFVVLCRTEGQARWALAMVARHLNGRGLALNSRKTRLLPPDQPFTFLGQTIEPLKGELAP